ncbi:superoxide dismutase family protein [Gordonia sp. ABSL11-1]|uniref:superoxide dismutase[Cu-Zn] n=1 Tax=Gordonia sp. ABSL11-1 TaxID=3053924 RepID=UPI002573F2E4|nr:superoxide dismutase family protein [Gordonia sp. ABSL11-1]MDL9946687.1 superoxide dismutase family protein [Gordonia sp. ABSL11-1]
MTASSIRIRRTLAVLASAGIVGGALAACTPDEPPTDAPGTTPSVVTGNQAPPGEVDDADGIGSSPKGNATANLIDDDGKTVGEAVFTPSGSSVKVDVRVNAESGIPAGFHGMHIHQNGVCQTGGSEAFSSAGSHLQVDGRTSHPSSGDLVSINVLKDGTGETVTTTDAVNLEQIVGKAIVIHEKADNFANIPTRYAPAPDEQTMKTGDAGSRLACGVIEAHE